MTPKMSSASSGVLPYLATMVNVSNQAGVTLSLLLAYMVKKWGLTPSPSVLLYLLYVWMDESPYRDGSMQTWFRKLSFWKHMAQYFDAQLVKSVDLKPDEGPYLFGLHPHGVFVFGAPLVFMSEACSFSRQFPGLDLRVAVVNVPFYMPVSREVALMSGCVSADKPTVMYNLKRGRSLLVVVGGADEALMTGERGGALRLVLEGRMGFVKSALEAGAALVPCLTFGENQTYQQVLSPVLRRWQTRLAKICGFSLPMLKANGVIPFMPRRVKLTTIVGPPLARRPAMCPSDPGFDAEVVKMHEEYIAALQAIHKKHWPKYGYDEERSLEFITPNEARTLLKDTSKPRRRKGSLPRRAPSTSVVGEDCQGEEKSMNDMEVSKL